MAKSTAAAKQARSDEGGPVSVVLPRDLKARVLTEAKKRGLKLSPAVRTLLQERVRELDDAEQLSRAEEWQRAQAWSTWDKIKAGDVAEVSKADLDAEFEEARSRRQR